MVKLVVRQATHITRPNITQHFHRIYKMFSLRKLLLNTTVQYQIKKFRHVKLDPGIRKRQNALLEPGEPVEEIDFDEYETDFMDVHKSHKEHVEEMKAQHEQLKYHITKQKYFKEKYPNFLTWHDKEQIKYLHSSDPEEWTIEKLSEGFPALPEVISKIVKGKWTKKNQNKVTNHDKTVQENWKLFKKNKLKDLPEDLVEHLKKFTNRALILKPFEPPDVKPVIDLPQKQGEFSEIISSYNKLANKHPKEAMQETNNQKMIESKKSINNNKLTTLNQLQVDIEKRLESGKYVTEEEKMLLQRRLEKSEVKPVELKTMDLELVKNKHVTAVIKPEKEYKHLMYPEKITIPAKLRKKDGLYKLNDCFYDEYGDFLYRVPGMY